MSGVGGPKRQVVDLEILVAAIKSEMETGRPSRDASVNAENAAFPIGLVEEPREMSPRERTTELQRGGISSVVRLGALWWSCELKFEEDRYVVWWTQVQLATTSANRCLATFNIPVVLEDEHEDLTLANGSVVQA